MPTQPERIIASVDRQLKRAEKSAIDDLERYLNTSLNDLLRMLRSRYGATLDELEGQPVTIRQARADALVNEVSLALNALSFRNADPQVRRAMNSLLAEAYNLGIANSAELLSALGEDPTFIGLDLDAITQIVTGSSQRLWRYSDEFIDKAKEIIVSGMVSGRGFRQVARDLRVANDTTRYQAERIVRTEAVSASDDARRDMYGQNGIEYVQRYTAQDTRVCGYCVARAGNVYLANEAPAALHPNDRCFNLPWKPEWVGTQIPTDFAQRHREQSRTLAEEQGVAPKFGRAPFEKMNDLPQPRRVA